MVETGKWWASGFIKILASNGIVMVTICEVKKICLPKKSEGIQQKTKMLNGYLQTSNLGVVYPKAYPVSTYW